MSHHNFLRLMKHLAPGSIRRTTTNCEVPALEAGDGAIRLPGSSHAEAALAGGSDVTIGLNFGVVKAGIKDFGTSTTGNEYSVVNLRSGDLVGNSWTVESGCAANDNGEQESKDGVLHVKVGLEEIVKGNERFEVVVVV